jgi:hypothetical protein
MEKKYGIKAYGSTKWFDSERAFRKHLLEWICCTEGAERSRAVDALANLDDGIPFTDTDCRR